MQKWERTRAQERLEATLRGYTGQVVRVDEAAGDVRVEFSGVHAAASWAQTYLMSAYACFWQMPETLDQPVQLSFQLSVFADQFTAFINRIHIRAQ